MSVIVIAGVPKNQKLLKFISFLQGLVGDVTINTSLIKTKYTNDFAKKIFINVRPAEARRMRRAVDGLVYKYAGREYPLQCWQEPHDSDSKITRHRNNDEDGLEYSQPSANLIDELQTIDKKIELVRKERLLIEEESRLLLEKKKLKILKNIDVNDVDNLKKFQEIKDRNNPAEIAELTREVIDKPILQRKLSCKKLPHFHGPCKALFAEMRDLINKYINPGNRSILLPLLRSAIKKRLVVVLQGKQHMVVSEIVREYREMYPMSTDDELLKDLIVTICQSCWPKPAGSQSDAGSDLQNKEKETEKVNKNVIDLTSEEINTSAVSADGENVKETTITDPEDADLVDMDKDFDDWIEDDDNQNLTTENVPEENNEIDNNKEVESQEKTEKDDIQMQDELLKDNGLIEKNNGAEVEGAELIIQ